MRGVRLDKTKPYAEMCGEEGVAYLQNGMFYDRNGLFVKDSGLPAPAKAPTLKAVKAVADMKAHQEAIDRASMLLGPFKVKSQEKLMEDAERENFRAWVAEEQAYQ